MKDQTGFTVEIPDLPRRIVSLVPSQTELLYDLGLEEEVVGITRFCVHPESWFHSKPRVGGTRQVHLDKLIQLAPDLVLANKEENVEEQIRMIRKFCPVWTSDIKNLRDALDMVIQFGEITGKNSDAEKIHREIRKVFEALPVTDTPLLSIYLIWQNPYMTVGRDTFIHDMMCYAGLKNAFEGHLRYPATSREEIISLKPDCLLLSSEPFPFNESHLSEWKEHLPDSKIMHVDGELFSWYGSRLILAAPYFQRILEDTGKNPDGWD